MNKKYDLLKYENNPYKLDEIIDKNNKFIAYALTRKNIDFIESVVLLDSNYKEQYKNEKKPGDNFEKFIKSNEYRKEISKDEKKKRTGKTWFKGNIQYWYKKLESNSNYTFEQSMYAIVSIVDSLNSTHLESCKNGRYEMTKRIFTEANNNLDGLKTCLINKASLIQSLFKGLPQIDDKKEHDRYNISFASKIYFYLYERFIDAKEYPVSKYDFVVAKNLPIYIDIYLSETMNESEFLINVGNNKKDNDDIFIKKTNKYDKYQEYIGKILSKLKEEENIEVNRNEFDHLVWWTNK